MAVTVFTQQDTVVQQLVMSIAGTTVLTLIAVVATGLLVLVFRATGKQGEHYENITHYRRWVVTDNTNKYVRVYDHP